MMISDIATFSVNPVYKLVVNVGSGPSSYYIARDKEDDSGDLYRELFTIEETPVYIKSIDSFGDTLARRFRKTPFITPKTYNEIKKEIVSLAKDNATLSEDISNSSLFGKELLEGQQPTQPKGDNEEMNTLEMKQFIKLMHEEQMELFRNMKPENPYEDAIVQAIIDKGKSISSAELLKEAQSKLDTFIQDTYGVLPKKIEIKTPDKDAIQLEGLFHSKFEHILQLVTVNIPTLLVGPAGSGKNHTLEQVAESLGLDFWFSNAITQEFKLTGFIDANGKYHETQFYKAFKNGGLFFLDELDASIPEVLLILNSAIANRYFDFPTGRVEAHEDFRVVAAANTMGTGADNLYTGRNQLDAATIDRFAQVMFDYDNEVEKQLSSNDDLFTFVTKARDAIKQAGLRYTVSMRSIINASKIDGVIDDVFAVEGIILKTMPIDEMKMIEDYLPRNNRYTDAFKSVIGWNGERYTAEDLQQLSLAA